MDIIRTNNPKVLEEIDHTRYVLHGSDRPLEVVEPKQAHGSEDDPLQNQSAVYGTLCVEIAAINAIIRPDPSEPGSTGAHWKLDVKSNLLCVWGTGLVFQNGFVHVLPIDTFKVHRVGTFCLSRCTVRTERIIEVEPVIFARFKGIAMSQEAISALDKALKAAGYKTAIREKT